MLGKTLEASHANLTLYEYVHIMCSCTIRKCTTAAPLLGSEIHRRLFGFPAPLAVAAVNVDTRVTRSAVFQLLQLL